MEPMQNEKNYQGTDPVNNNEIINPVPLRSSVGILILGIFSFILSLSPMFFVVGLILGILSFLMSKKLITEYNENPANFTRSSFTRIKFGRICSIIGFVFCAGWIVYYILALATGAEFF
jgi:hypothetical protein